MAPSPDVETGAVEEKPPLTPAPEARDEVADTGAAAAAASSSTSAAATAAGGGKVAGAAACSFSQLLAGAMGSAAAGGATLPILTVPVDGGRVPVIAVPCIIAPASLLESPGFMFAMTHQAVLATVTAQAQLQLQLQATNHAASSDNLINSASPPLLSAITALPLQQRPPPVSEDNTCLPEIDQILSPQQKNPSARLVPKTNSSDGYNWRKYGQKQVKGNDSSRSYYRCASADCFVKKKVQHFQDGRVIETIYSGFHNHDPPQKTRISKERKSLSAASHGESEELDVPSGESNETHPVTPKMEQSCSNASPEEPLHSLSDCEGNACIMVEDNGDEAETKQSHLGDEPEPKRRLCEITATTTPPQFKTAKEPKVVIQSGGDVSLKSDGYKWRKYGQKFVKGNPNPRSYYRCTQFGCPVRKHVERASDNAGAFVITYEGKHIHDQASFKNMNMPVSPISPATPIVPDRRRVQGAELSPDQKPKPKLVHPTSNEMDDSKRVASEKGWEPSQALMDS